MGIKIRCNDCDVPINNTECCMECGSTYFNKILICDNEGCGEILEHFSGLEQIPEYEYCPICNDIMYDDEGNVKGELF